MINLCIGHAFWMIRLLSNHPFLTPPSLYQGDPSNPPGGWMEKPPNRFVAAPADLSENAGLDATGWSGMSHVLHLEGH